MGFPRRRRVGVLIVVAVALSLTLPAAPAVAGSLDACAQRVIRDWYTGGRVDNVYPLGCYRAAIRALPADVLQYSNADQDIRRALAFARRGRADPGNESLANAPRAGATAPPAEETTSPGEGTQSAAESTTSTAEARPSPVANEAVPPPRKARIVAETSPAAAAVPYPIVALAGLSVVLLATGAAGWLASRRR